VSWQAVDAVIFESGLRDCRQFRLLAMIGSFCDPAGIADPGPSQATLADCLGVTDRTVRKLVSKLEASGELERPRIGRGPGQATAYQINLPSLVAYRDGIATDLEGDASGYNRKKSAVANGIATDLEGDASGYNRKKSALIPEKSALIPENPPVQTRRRSIYDPYSDPVGGPSRPPTVVHKLDPEQPFDAKILALAAVCGLDPHLPAHRAQLDGAAAQLARYGAADVLAKFGESPSGAGGWNWYANDFRGRRGDPPSLKWVLENIAKTAPAKLNGRGARGAGDLVEIAPGVY
jgi:hypothetical protein